MAQKTQNENNGSSSGRPIEGIPGMDNFPSYGNPQSGMLSSPIPRPPHGSSGRYQHLRENLSNSKINNEGGNIRNDNGDTQSTMFTMIRKRYKRTITKSEKLNGHVLNAKIQAGKGSGFLWSLKI